MKPYNVLYWYMIILIMVLSAVSIAYSINKIKIQGETYKLDITNDIYFFIWLQGCLLLYSLNPSVNVLPLVVFFSIFMLTVWFSLRFAGYNTSIIVTESNEIINIRKPNILVDIMITVLVMLSIGIIMIMVKTPGKIYELTSIPFEFTVFLSTVIIPVLVVTILLENNTLL